jgi:hypothetical protein
MGNLNVKGGGGCPNWAGIPPADCLKLGAAYCSPNPYPIPNGSWEGYIYVAGKFFCSGSLTVYGTFSGATDPGAITGSVEIWYKTGNKALGYLGQSVYLKYWRERKPETWDVFP